MTVYRTLLAIELDALGQLFRRITDVRGKHVRANGSRAAPRLRAARARDPDRQLRLHRSRQYAKLDFFSMRARQFHLLPGPQLLNQLDVTKHDFFAVVVAVR